jgi:hypothetical protein
MKISKPIRILERVNRELMEKEICTDGMIMTSARGVPYLWLSRNKYNISVCYFMRDRCLKMWTGCGTMYNKYYCTVKQWTELIPQIKKLLILT